MAIDLSNKNNYEILGVKEYFTNTEITEAYKALKAKYSEERFAPGEAGNDAAEMLEAIENAYRDIMTERKADGFREPTPEHGPHENTQKSSGGSGQSDKGGNYAEVDKLIKEGKIDDAQRVLDGYSERLAEWHYLQAVIYYKKNWGNECKKQLEIAMTKDPGNAKYKEAYDKLVKEINYTNKTFTSGNAQGQTPNRDFDPYDRQMGGNDCMESFCQCLACNALLNCCCNCR